MTTDEEISNAMKEILAENQKKDEHIKISEAYQNARLSFNAPEIFYPNKELKSIIIELLPYLNFQNPKMIFSLPDGKIKIRDACNNETPDDYSIEIHIAYYKFDHYYISIFKDGRISLYQIYDSDYGVSPAVNVKWDELKTLKLDESNDIVSLIKKQIIKWIAEYRIDNK